MPLHLGMPGEQNPRTHPCNYCPAQIPWGTVCWMIHTKPITTMCNDCHETREP